MKYIDGGWRDNMPLDLAAAMGAGELLAVDVNGVGITRPNTTGLPTRIIRSHWNLGPTLDFAPGAPPATLPWATLIRCGCLTAWAAQPTASCRTAAPF